MNKHHPYFFSILIAFALLVFISPAGAQDGKLKKANRAYENYELQKAVELYESVLIDTANLKRIPLLKAKINLAEAYRKMNKIGMAEKYYGEIVNSRLSRDEYIYHYARALMANGKYEEAKIWFQKFAELEPADERPGRMINACNLIAESFLRPSPFHIKNMPFNSPNSDFSAIPWGGGVLFTSGRRTGLFAPKFEWNNTPFFDLYYSAFDDSLGFQEAVRIKGSVNTKWHEGPASVSLADSQLYFTRNNYYQFEQGVSNAGVVKLNVYTAKYQNGKWVNTQEISLNHPQFSTAHPTITEDGNTMFFVSDKPGGSGGTDIYMAERVGGTRWARPVNLGSKINTEGNEMFPFIWKDSLLFFSTDGQTVFGGLDIYMASKDRFGEWKKPVNLGYPINSTSDDFGFYIDSNYASGYFSSNRDGGMGDDDIYGFTRNTIRMKGLVVDNKTHETLSKANVELIFTETGQLAAKSKTSASGYFEFEIIPGIAYTLQTDYPAYNENTILIKTNEQDKEILLPVFLQRTIIYSTVFFNFQTDSWHFLPDLIQVHIKLSGDSTFSQVLNLPKRKGVVRFGQDSIFTLCVKIPGFYTWRDTLSTMHIIKPQVFDLNIFLRPVITGEMMRMAISLDDTFNPMPGSVREIYRIYDLLFDNEALQIEIGAHTSSEGSKGYNLEHTQKIANAIRTKLAAMGIDEKRLTAIGYGEKYLLNDCNDKVPCSEAEHQVNKRIEIKILGLE